jgi:bleomycin hydrolase
MATKIVGALDETTLNKFASDYEKDSKNPVIRHALVRTPISGVVYEGSSLEGVKNKFSLEIKTLPVANQKASGRCWIFAGLNILREIIAKKCKMTSFELSQNYVSLFDKIEKANFALETIITFAGRDHDDRELSFVLHDPVGDGGQWDMFVNLVKKYGVVPQDVFPETYQSNNTRESNQLCNTEIRHFAAEVSHLVASGKQDEIRPLKNKVMERIYALYLNCFGVPPKSFDFEYTDNKNVYHIDKGLTPLSFFNNYVGEIIDEYQSIINSPTPDKPFNKNYTIDYLGNVIEGKKINHLNLPMSRIKELIVKQLEAGYPVWFGSDVGYFRDRGSYAWDSHAFDYPSEFGFDVRFDKSDMLSFWHSAMNHAMVITGVNFNDKKEITRYKIENSWGPENGVSGYYVMSNEWFDSYVYQAVILSRFLNEEEKKATLVEPIHLHPWDPMGTLAD